MESKDIDVEKDFFEIGMDSKALIMSVEELEKKMGNKLYPTLLFEYTSIEKLAGYLAEEYGETYPRGLNSDIVDKSYINDLEKNDVKEPCGEVIDFCYRPKWIRNTIEPLNNGMQDGDRTGGSSEEGAILIVYHENDLGITTMLEKAFASSLVYKIRLGTEIKMLSEREWEVDTSDSSAFNSCIARLTNIYSVYFMGGICTETADLDNFKALEQSQKQGILCLFRLLKSLSKNKKIRKIRKLKIITNNIHQVLPGDQVIPYSASLLGLTKSLAKEYPKIEITGIDISIDDIKGKTEKESYDSVIRLLTDDAGLSGHEDIAVRNGNMYSRVLEAYSLGPVPTSVFKQNGVYVILGGTGGIGLELGSYLAENFQAVLVLLGRSELNSSKRKAISDIESKGGKVLYIKADGAKFRSIKAAVQKAKATFGRINGVIHSALVLKDKVFENMDEESLQDVLAPKVIGSMALYKAVKDEPIDFLMFFSSVQSFIGNVGQANYAAASAFQDAFALALSQRENFPIKLINWGYWGSVGVVATEQYNKILSKSGIQSIQPQEGMKTIERFLGHDINQLIPFKVEAEYKEKYKELFEDSGNGLIDKTPLFFERLSYEMPAMSGKIDAYNMEAFDAIGRYGSYLLLDAFQKMGVFEVHTEKYNIEDLKKKLRIIPSYNRLFEALLDILERAGFVKITDRIAEGTPKLDEVKEKKELKNLERMKSDLTEKMPEIEPYINLMWVCVSEYGNLLTGKKNHVTVMFPKGSTELVEKVYKGDSVSDYFNHMAADIIRLFVEMRLKENSTNKLRILEVGAGTGATSEFVLNKLKQYHNRLQYLYTDISLDLTAQNIRKFKDNYSFVEFRDLDIEKDPYMQGFDSEGFDVILGSNVFHATSNINNSIAQAKKLLKKDGIFIINELTQLQDFATLTFGLTKGWWLFEDEENRIKGSPLLSVNKWTEIMGANGLEKIKVFGLSGFIAEQSPQNIIVGMHEDSRRALVGGERQAIIGNAANKLDWRKWEGDADKIVERLQPVNAVEEDDIKMLEMPISLESPFEDFVHYWKQLRDGVILPVIKRNIDRESILKEVKNNREIKQLLVEVDSTDTLEVIVAGAGSPILFLTAFKMTAPQWYYQIREFSRDHQTIVIHIPGCGLSKGGKEFSFSRISKLLIAVLDKLQINWPIHMVGSSWGGISAQYICAEYPEKIASLTLCGSMYAVNANARISKERIKEDSDSQEIQYYTIFDDILFDHGDGPNYGDVYISVGFSTENILDKITVPTLIIVGKKDILIDPEQSKILHSRIKNSQYIEIEKGGHALNFSNLEFFNSKVIHFIDEQEAERKNKEGYSRNFYKFIRTGSRNSAIKVFDFLMPLLKASSAIDFGCGVGSWLNAAQLYGVREVKGLDGSYVDRAQLMIPADCFQEVDFERYDYTFNKEFDLAISLEVAEHISGQRAESFIKSITSASDIVLFSAAVPGQGGVNHVNEQNADYWYKIFKKYNYIAYDFREEVLWKIKGIEFWYAQNMILYCHKDVTLPKELDCYKVTDRSLNKLLPGGMKW
ncbi:MAG: alpha/beta fold hydrolase [Bacillota bacterium]|nr:alpha/beta fold hydrolase [Bacillota bacterium]